MTTTPDIRITEKEVYMESDFFNDYHKHEVCRFIRLGDKRVNSSQIQFYLKTGGTHTSPIYTGLSYLVAAPAILISGIGFIKNKSKMNHSAIEAYNSILAVKPIIERQDEIDYEDKKELFGSDAELFVNYLNRIKNDISEEDKVEFTEKANNAIEKLSKYNEAYERVSKSAKGIQRSIATTILYGVIGFGVSAIDSSQNDIRIPVQEDCEATLHTKSSELNYTTILSSTLNPAIGLYVANNNDESVTAQSYNITCKPDTRLGPITISKTERFNEPKTFIEDDIKGIEEIVRKHAQEKIRELPDIISYHL